MRVRQFTMDDYDSVWQLWHACHIPLGQSDTRPEIEKKLERDPDLFLVAEMNEACLGVAIGAWDGRQGWIYNHAVEPRCRKMGIGSELIKEVERRLIDKGALQISLVVAKDNLEAQDFYEAIGFKVDDRQLVMVKTLKGSVGK